MVTLDYPNVTDGGFQATNLGDALDPNPQSKKAF